MKPTYEELESQRNAYRDMGASHRRAYNALREAVRDERELWNKAGRGELRGENFTKEYVRAQDKISELIGSGGDEPFERMPEDSEKGRKR